MSPEEATESEATPVEPTAEERQLEERRRAALALVRQFGDPVLKSPASAVTEFGAGLASEAARMVAIMEDSLGIGLAATQLGVMRRLLVFRAGPDSEPRALVNPVIAWSSDDLVTAEEGCLSLSGVVVDVERPLHARVTGHDTAGEPILLEASGLEARVLQHEIDHLDGVLILDRTIREQRRAALGALRAGEPFSPSMLEEPDDAEVADVADDEAASDSRRPDEVGEQGPAAE